MMMQSQRTVLIVDDFPLDRETYRRYLASDPEVTYTVLEAESAEDGLALCQIQQLDGILLDFLLPDLDGLQFLAMLKAQVGESCPPVVMMSGRGDESIAVKAIKSGAEDYLVKDRITPDGLRSTLRTAIENAELRLALHQSEERFRTSVENMLDCFGICSAIRDQSGQIVDFRIDYLNAAALENTQLTQAHIGQRLCEVFPSHFESGMFDAYCQVVETGQPFAKESLIYSDQLGTQCLTRAYDIRASQLGDGFVTAWRDITEKKQTEQALRQSEERYRAIVEDQTELICRFLADGTLTFVNGAYCRHFGATPEDLIGRSFLQLVPDADQEVVRQQIDALNALTPDHSILTQEHTVLKPNGEIGWQQWTNRAIFNSAGQLVEFQAVGRDISERVRVEDERKHYEQQLQTHQQLLQGIVEASPGLIYLFDLIDRKNLFITPQAQNLIGYSAEEITAAGADFMAQHMHPDDLARFPAHVECLSRSSEGETVAFEYRMHHRNGEWRWFLSQDAVFARTTDGRPKQVLGIAQDISDRVRGEAERKAAEVASRESEARLRLALEAACMGTWDWNILTNEIVWSTNMEPLFGLEPGSFDGRYETFVNCLHPDDRDRVLNAISGAVNQGEAYEIEFRVVFPNGQVRWAASRGQVYYDATGRAIRMAGVDLDITDRKCIEEVLREREALFRGVFESDLMGILFWNIEGQITDANEAFCRLTGYCHEELQSGQIYYHNITPPEYHELDAQKFETLQTTGKYLPVEKEYICKDGSRIPILLGCAFLPGSQDHGVAFVLDIREQKRLQQEREILLADAQAAREAAELANRTKDEFLAIVSHELRSPLNAILGWAQLIRTRTYNQATLDRALETIERNAKAQSQLIEDLLDISRILRGNLHLDVAPIQLASIVEVVVTNVQLAAEAKQIQLRSTVDPTVGRVLGDINRLQQIVTNLLTNAIKFTPTGGQVEVSLVQMGTHAAVRVSDTGQGISPEFLPSVFERFRQAENGTTRSKDGLGLGLAIVRHLVELHGGTVKAESPGIGQGATFTVTFPLIDEPSQPVSRNDAAAIADLSQLKILIVDDAPDTCDFLQFALTDYGATVAIAYSASQAYEVFQQFAPDVLLSDIGMPEEDGYSLLQGIRQLTQGKSVLAIALTAYAKPEDRDFALSAGFQGYLAKPVEPDEIVTTIVNLLKTRSIPTCS